MRTSTRTATALAMVGVALLSACGSGEGDGADDTDADADAGATAAAEFPTEDVSLTLWWWGETEAPGAEAWLADAITAYQEKRPNVTIEPVLQTTDALIPAFQAAAAAQQGPDIQYFWGGIYSQEPGWAGSIVPVSDYIPAEELDHYLNADLESSFDGGIWTAPWYVNPSFPVVVRKDLLAEYDLEVPQTWDELMTTCDVLSGNGVTTLAGGVKDGWFGGWLYSMIGGQAVQSQQDVIAASVGEQSFTDPMHAQWWTKLEQSRERGCWNDDINSLELYQAQELFISGEAAMTVTAGPDAPNIVEQAGGADVIEIITMPAWAEGPYAGKMGTTSQTLGISSWTEYPQVAADFIMFTHTEEMLQSWYDATGSLPADDRFDVSGVTDPVRRSLFELALDGSPYVENFIPAQLDAEGVFPNVQLVLEGSQSAEGAAQDMQAVAERIRTSNRELVDNFATWSQ